MVEAKILRDVEINGDTFPLVVETSHGRVTAMTAVHRREHEQRQGGVRFVRQGTLAELGHLARGMTEKCAASRIPLSGLKCLVICPEGEPDTHEEKAEVLASHIRVVIKEEPGAVFGPDMGCPEGVLSRVAREPELLGHVTGLTAEWGGLEIDNRGYTAYGLVHAIGVATPEPFAALTFSIQGFGAVGAHAANLIAQRGGTVRAASNKEGALTNRHGLDVARLFGLWKEFGDECLEIYAREDSSTQLHFSAVPEYIFEMAADVFIPAARTTVLALPEELPRARTENPHSHDVTHFLAATRVRLVAEGANHPLTEGSERYLEEQGVRILPDVLANCGGMIGCYLEWVNRAALMAEPERLSEVDGECRNKIRRTIERNVSELIDSRAPARMTARQIVESSKGVECNSW